MSVEDNLEEYIADQSAEEDSYLVDDNNDAITEDLKDYGDYEGEGPPRSRSHDEAVPAVALHQDREASPLRQPRHSSAGSEKTTINEVVEETHQPEMGTKALPGMSPNNLMSRKLPSLEELHPSLKGLQKESDWMSSSSDGVVLRPPVFPSSPAFPTTPASSSTHGLRETVNSESTEARELQSMADLLRQHQLEELEQATKERANDWPSEHDVGSPSTQQPEAISDVSREEETEALEETDVVKDEEGKSNEEIRETTALLSSYPEESMNVDGSNMSSKVLGKRKAVDEEVDELESSRGTSLEKSTSRMQLAADGSSGEIDPRQSIDYLNNDHPGTAKEIEDRKKRRKRKKKPIDQPATSPVPDTVPAGSRPVKAINQHMETLQFKRHGQRRWMSLKPYTAMMGVILKTLLTDRWSIIAASIARITAPGEEKDIRKIKQTWANEYTRFKTHSEKDRLVTIRTLNSSWPWSLKEKEQLWKTATFLCADTTDWNKVVVNVNKVLEDLGEPQVTIEQCKYEWENVLKWEYMDGQPAESLPKPVPVLPSEEKPSETLQSLTAKSAPTERTKLPEITIPSLGSSASARASLARQNDATLQSFQSILDNVSTPSQLPPLQAQALARKNEMDAYPRPVNLPLQVQPTSLEDADGVKRESLRPVPRPKVSDPLVVPQNSAQPTEAESIESRVRQEYESGLATIMNMTDIEPLDQSVQDVLHLQEMESLKMNGVHQHHVSNNQDLHATDTADTYEQGNEFINPDSHHMDSDDVGM